jgi:RHS repeat-associated protein
VYRRWLWEDPIGSGVHVTDDRGAFVHQRAFEPFGDLFKERTTEVTERSFAGHRFEDNSGLYYMRARWYDPVVGRFLATDPVVRSSGSPQSINAYSYVENNPINRVDPTGLQASQACVGPATASMCVTEAPGAGAERLRNSHAGGNRLILERHLDQLAQRFAEELERSLQSQSTAARVGGFVAGVGTGVLIGAAIATAPVTLIAAGTVLIGGSELASGFAGTRALAGSLQSIWNGDGNGGDFFAAGNLVGGVGRGIGGRYARAGAGATEGVATPFGTATQATSPAALAARTRVSQGATLCRIGTTGRSAAAEGQFWSLEHPFSPGFASRYGIPAQNVKNANFIESGVLKPGTPFVTRQAPGVGQNIGGGVEVVVPEGGVLLRGFSHLGG